MWNEDTKLILKYSKSEDVHESNFRNIIKIQTRMLISESVAFFATIVGKVYMSG